jgi:hypothetical protein
VSGIIIRLGHLFYNNVSILSMTLPKKKKKKKDATTPFIDNRTEVAKGR